MVRMAPTVLKDADWCQSVRSRALREACDKLWTGSSRNNRERNRYIRADREQTVEPSVRRRRIIVSPPEGCDPPGFPPPVKLVFQIAPPRHCRPFPTRQLTHLLIILPGRANTNLPCCIHR